MPTAGLANNSSQIMRDGHQQSRTPQRMPSNNSKTENKNMSIQPGMTQNQQQTSSQQN
jgi:hypothetical protein